MLLIFAILALHCDKADQETANYKAIANMKQYQSTPTVLITKIHGASNLDESQKIRIRNELKKQLTVILDMIVNKNFDTLLDHVHPESGLWIDLKSHKSYAELDKQIRDPYSYLNVFYHNSELLKLRTGEMDKRTVREVLLVTDTISAEIFVESNDDFELKLTLDKAEKLSYYLNSPVFRFRNNRYYVYRLP